MKLLHIFTLIVSSVWLTSFSTQTTGSHEVKGIVIDAYKKPIAGVNIIQKSTTNATVTNHNGEFSITLPAQEVNLLFAFTSYKTFEVKIKSDDVKGKLYEVTMFSNTHIGKRKGSVRVVLEPVIGNQ